MLEYGDMPKARHEWPESLREYFQFRDHLYTLDGVLMYKERIVIPSALRDDCIQALHSAHQGTAMMTARGESSVFWPGISKAIANARASCGYCNRMAPSQPSAPPMPRLEPAYTFQCIYARII